MISVYRVIPNLKDYSYIMTDDAQATLDLRFDGSKVSDYFSLPDLYFANTRKPIPDIIGCFCNPAAFAVSAAAAKSLITFLDQSCDVLRAGCDGANVLICNVTCVTNSLNVARSSFKSGLVHWVEDYVFHASRFEYSLFKLPQTAMSEVLCVEGLMGPADEFKGRVEQCGLTGLSFRKIWSDNGSRGG